LIEEPKGRVNEKRKIEIEFIDGFPDEEKVDVRRGLKFYNVKYN
jgi:hypothetical protein